MLALVALGVFSRIPEAEREDAIRLRVGDDHGLVDESGLPLQDGQDLVIDGVAELACLSDLLVNSTVLVYMGSTPFGWWEGMKGTSRILRGDRWLPWNATNLRWLVESVNCLHSGGDAAALAVDDRRWQGVPSVLPVGEVCRAARDSGFALSAAAARRALGTCREFLKGELYGRVRRGPA